MKTKQAGNKGAELGDETTQAQSPNKWPCAYT